VPWCAWAELYPLLGRKPATVSFDGRFVFKGSEDKTARLEVANCGTELRRAAGRSARGPSTLRSMRTSVLLGAQPQERLPGIEADRHRLFASAAVPVH